MNGKPSGNSNSCRPFASSWCVMRWGRNLNRPAMVSRFCNAALFFDFRTGSSVLSRQHESRQRSVSMSVGGGQIVSTIFPRRRDGDSAQSLGGHRDSKSFTLCVLLNSVLKVPKSPAQNLTTASFFTESYAPKTSSSVLRLSAPVVSPLASPRRAASRSR